MNTTVRTGPGQRNSGPPAAAAAQPRPGRRGRPGRPARPAARPAAGTVAAPAARAVTEPAAGARTEPAAGARTEPAARARTEPAARARTEPKARIGARPKARIAAGPAARATAPAAARATAPAAARVTAPPAAKTAVGSAQAGAGTGRATAAAGRRSAARTPFILLVCGLLGGGLICLLVINTTLAAASYRINALQRSNTEAAQRVQELQQQVATEESPGSIEQRAQRLGLREQPVLNFVDLRTGRSYTTPATAPGVYAVPGYTP